MCRKGATQVIDSANVHSFSVATPIRTSPPVENHLQSRFLILNLDDNRSPLLCKTAFAFWGLWRTRVAKVEKSELLRRFTQTLQSNDAALFIGAGMSKASGFVDWKGLLRDIAQDLGLDIDREADLIAVAQYHVNIRGGRAGINRALIEEFTKYGELTENHRLIATLPIRTIWTTNYDDLLETAFREAHKRPDVKTTTANLAQTMPNRDVVIYKMHGDAKQPQDAVLTKEDYETYQEKRELFSTVLKGDLVSETFLFLGFSFTDPNIDYIFGRIRALLGQNQRDHYCVMKWPEKPVRGAKERAEYDYQMKKLELRIGDLSRYSIHAVMVDQYDEITEILRALNQGSHFKYIFVSGSAQEFAPLGRDRVERLAHSLGKETISRGFNLVSGLGWGIGGAVTLGAIEQIYADSRSMDRLLLLPFPQSAPVSMTERDFHRAFRTNMISNAGFSVFICGNRKLDAVISIAGGVLEEFEITHNLGRYPIPIGATGHAARQIWEEVGRAPELFFGENNVGEELKVLGDSRSSNEQLISAVFGMINVLSR
jgi:hypothetical protein